MEHKRGVRRYGWLAIGIAVSVLLAACATLTTMKLAGRDRGLRFSHATHEEAELACDDCHQLEDGKETIPGHDVCSLCHDIDTDNPTPEDCGVCHTRGDYAVEPWKPVLSNEINFSHLNHVEKASIKCGVCHQNPDKRVLPKGPLMPWCMDCHKKENPALNECAVCHKEIRKDRIPAERHGARIAHDAPGIWEITHGNEYRYDPGYCRLCHDDQSFCDSCHQEKPPRDHTIAWRRKPHGLKAAWDRDRCAVCHEEDMCWKCHQETEPASHRGGWGFPLNRHCANCHFPPQDAGCTTCHVRIEHREAKPSPHVFGVYPSRCAGCHPGGNPFLAPHHVNSTTTCAFCHH